ncbi:MAG: SIMPL domain-containing protein [Burkholderiales bacterium]
MRIPLFVPLLALAMLTYSHASSAQAAPPLGPQEPRWNQVDLEAEVAREVQNDTVVATLYTEVNEANPAIVASQMNRTVADALKAAGGVKSVKPRTGGNFTYPVYDKANRVTGWRGRAEIRLESQDFQAMADLIGKLQASMQLAGVAFAVSPELRRRTENELIEEAVAAFRARAEVATRALGGKSYRIRRVALDTTGAFPAPRPFTMHRGSVAMAAEAPPPPPLEGGTSSVRVGAAGTIEVE